MNKQQEQPIMDIVKQTDKLENNLRAGFEHNMQEVGKKIAPASAKAVEIGSIAVDRLLSFIERIEKLSEEKKDISDDIASIYAEAKGVGFDIKIMKAVIKLRKMTSEDRDNQQYLMDVYCKALDL